jgi:hypothetical protein
VYAENSRCLRLRTLALLIAAVLSTCPALAQTGAGKPADTPTAPKSGTAPSKDAPTTDDGTATDEEAAAGSDRAAVSDVAPLSESLTGMARAEYEAGKILYADGGFKGAGLKFRAAYEASKDPRLLWNVAASEKNQRHYVIVIELVKRYMSEAASMLSADEYTDANALLETVEGFVGDVTFNVNEPGAEVYVDDHKIGTSPLPGAVQIDMGERKIRVVKAGFLPFQTSWSVPGGSPSTVDVSLEKEIHQGRLRLVAGEGDTIRVDGKVLGAGQWEGTLASGIHGVQVSAPGKRTYSSDVAVRDNELTTLRVTLESETAAAATGGSSGWLWLAGGAVVAGLGVGAYYLFRPDDPTPPPYVEGTLEPGIIPVGRF